MMTVTEINRAYEHLTKTSIAAFETNEVAINEKTALEIMKANALADGRINGKNQEQRDAQAHEIFAPEFARLEALETAARRAQYEKTLASLDVERVKLIIRLAELNNTKEVERSKLIMQLAELTGIKE